MDPNDRGDRKGKMGPPMDLHYRWPERKLDIEIEDDRVEGPAG